MFLLIRNIFITGQVWHGKKNVYCRDDKKTRSEFMYKMTNKIRKSADRRIYFTYTVDYRRIKIMFVLRTFCIQ